MSLKKNVLKQVEKSALMDDEIRQIILKYIEKMSEAELEKLSTLLSSENHLQKRLLTQEIKSEAGFRRVKAFFRKLKRKYLHREEALERKEVDFDKILKQDKHG